MHKPTRVAAAVAGAFAPMRMPMLREPEPEPQTLQLNVAVENGMVVLRTSHTVNAVGFTVDEARGLAGLLLANADALKAAQASAEATPQPQPEST